MIIRERIYVADDNEIKKILSVERKVLKDMGFESKSHVMCKMKMQIFYDNVYTYPLFEDLNGSLLKTYYRNWVPF